MLLLCLPLQIIYAQNTKPLYQLPEKVSATAEAQGEADIFLVGSDSGLFKVTSSNIVIPLWTEARVDQLVKVKMREDIAAYHLILEQIDIREVYYNQEYENSINQKKLEEQKALTLIEVTKQKEELLKQAQIQKDIDITQAEAEAQALKIKGQSISTNPRIVELEWINKWNGQLPTYMLGNGQSIMLGINK